MGDKQLLTLITFTNRTLLSLAEYNVYDSGAKHYSYQIEGIGVDSPELVFNNLSPPLSVSVDEEFQIWYGHDLTDTSEINNSGETCVDVYALYAS